MQMGLVLHGSQSTWCFDCLALLIAMMMHLMIERKFLFHLHILIVIVTGLPVIVTMPFEQEVFDQGLQFLQLRALILMSRKTFDFREYAGVNNCQQK